MNKRYGVIFLIIALLSAIPCMAGDSLNLPWQEDLRLKAAFDESGLQGSFVMLDCPRKKLIGYHEKRARERFVPASTFKIPNTLIGLAVGAVKGVDEVFPYDGGPRFYKTWEKSMDLREAIKVSNVPVYQELAKRIGLKRMKEQLDLLGYGNREVGDKVDTFWLEGPLKINSIEQVSFLEKLAKEELPVPKEIQKKVKEILLVEETGDYKIFAKTGSKKIDGMFFGWWVGWVEKKDAVYPFALNVDIDEHSLLPEKRIALCRKCLQILGVLQVPVNL